MFAERRSFFDMSIHDLYREWLKTKKNPPKADSPPAHRYIFEELDRLATLEQEEEMEKDSENLF